MTFLSNTLNAAVAVLKSAHDSLYAIRKHGENGRLVALRVPPNDAMMWIVFDFLNSCMTLKILPKQVSKV